MPYSEPKQGIYLIVNTVTRQAYVGQSQWVKKRIAEHFRLLRANKHTNPKLQHSFNKYGEEAFEWRLEVECVDKYDMDSVEEAFLQGRAWFEEPCEFNIAVRAHVPMRDRCHSSESRRKMSLAHRGKKPTPSARKNMSLAQTNRHWSNPAFRDKVRFVVDNPQMSYAARARHIGQDVSSTRRLALKYEHLRGTL